MIVLGDFKEFNGTLTKTEIQIRSSSGYHRRLLVQVWKPTVKHEVQSISRSVPVTCRVSKTFEGVLWTVKKLKTKISNTGLRSVSNAMLIQASVQFKTRDFFKPAFNSKREAQSKTVSNSKREAQSKPTSNSKCRA